MANNTIPEEWRVVENWPDYEVSNLGRMRRATDGISGIGAVTYPKGYIHKMGVTKGYHVMTLSGPNGKISRNVCTIVCAAFHGPKPSPHHEAAHENGNRLDDREKNLRWATRLENIEDKKRHGRQPRGSTHWRTVLSEDQVREIKAQLAKGTIRAIDLARQYGVSNNTIANIKSGAAWRWLT